MSHQPKLLSHAQAPPAYRSLAPPRYAPAFRYAPCSCSLRMSRNRHWTLLMTAAGETWLLSLCWTRPQTAMLLPTLPRTHRRRAGIAFDGRWLGYCVSEPANGVSGTAGSSERPGRTGTNETDRLSALLPRPAQQPSSRWRSATLRSRSYRLPTTSCASSAARIATDPVQRACRISERVRSRRSSGCSTGPS